MAATTPTTSDAKLPLALPIRKPGDPVPAGALTKGSRIEGSLPEALKGKEYLVSDLTFMDKVQGFSQKYRISITWIVLPLIAGLGLVLFGKAATAVLAGKVLVVVAGLTCARQIYLSAMRYSKFYGSQGILVSYVKDELKHPQERTEITAALNDNWANKHPKDKHKDSTKDYNYAWLKVAIATHPELLSTADDCKLTPLQQATLPEIDDKVAAAMIETAIARNASRNLAAAAAAAAQKQINKH